VEETRNEGGILIEKLERKINHFEDVGVDKRMILKCIIKIEYEGLNWLSIESSGGLLCTRG
jgi:hypothetical protein